MAGSEGLFSPRTSPDHTRLAALRASNGELLVYEFATREWRAIGPPGSGYPNWRRDSKVIVCLNTGSQDTRIEQVTMDGKVSRVARVAGIQRPATALGQWMGLTPDGTPLITRDLTAYEIQALRWRTK